MEAKNIEEQQMDLNALLYEFDLDINSDSDDEDFKFVSGFRKPPPAAPKPPPTVENFVDFAKYVEEKCENKIKILDRSTFHCIKLPIVIAFNHFREKCYYQTKRLDTFYQLALKYGDRIEFIVADQIDLDVIYPHTNSIQHFCYLVSPEGESCMTFAIDEMKRIHQHYDAYQTLETLSEELCENLLADKLYLSQPVPEQMDTLVKTCVHQNYESCVAKSTKDILLIVGLGNYKSHEEHEPDYESIAKELNDENVDIVYIDGDKNYVPFEFNANCYPTIIFIPHDDKNDFMRYSHTFRRNTETVTKFIKNNIGPHGFTYRQTEKIKLQYKPFTLPGAQELQFDDLSQYIKEKFPESLQVLDRNTFDVKKSKSRCIIIYFMDFKGRGIKFYMQTLQNIYQVANAKYNYSVVYYVADLEDIDVIYPKWYHKYIDEDVEREKPQVYAVDRLKRISKVAEPKTASSLFYFSYNLVYAGLLHSQPRTASINSNLVKICVGDNWKMFFEKPKSDMFLTIYWPTYRASFKLLNVLEEIAEEAKQMQVQVIKMDAKHNYVPLEYTSTSYPVQFFIPRLNGNEKTVRYAGKTHNSEALLEFIRSNIDTRV